MKIDYRRDGVDHINCYSKGKTELGVMLGNLYNSPFIHDEDGPFESIEAYWYWLQTNNNSLRFLHGIEAKRAGQKAVKESGSVFREDFQKKIKEALNLKIQENSEIKSALIESKLPLIHYYVRTEGNKTFSIPLKKHEWIFKEIEKIRNKLNGIEVTEEFLDEEDVNTMPMF